MLHYTIVCYSASKDITIVPEAPDHGATTTIASDAISMSSIVSIRI